MLADDRMLSNVCKSGWIVAIVAGLNVAASFADEPMTTPPGSANSAPAAGPDTSPKTGDWTPADIAAERAECITLLRDVDVDFSYIPPIRQGPCGLAQPIELRGIGSHPYVKLDPPAAIDCKMASQLSRWFADSVQPLADTWLKSQIASIRIVGSFYCRYKSGDVPTKLDEHAKGNAIDISAFTTSTGTTVTVGQSWGSTLRGLLLASTPKAANDASGATANSGAPQPEPGQQAASRGEGADAIRAARLAELAKRGIALPKPSTPESNFIHAIHDAACNKFGTVLGPEANNDHNEHFHLDMKPRPGSYCE